MADAYDYWRRELDLPGSQRRETEEAILGWWRVRGAKTKWDNPAVIWKDDNGKTWLKRGHSDPWAKDSNEYFGWTQWQFVKADAVTTEEYEAAMRDGVWPDGKAAFPPKRAEGVELQPRGDLIHDPENDGPLIEQITDEIDSLADAIESFGDVDSQAKADRLGEMYRRMRQLWKKADTARVAEKEPHLEASRAVDNEWRPALDRARDWGERADDKIKRFLKAEEARQRQAWEAEQARLAAERPPAEEPPQTRREPPPTARASGGSAGKAVSLTTRRKGVIVNETKFINAIKKRSDFQEFIQKIADGLARAKQPTNGLEIKEVRE